MVCSICTEKLAIWCSRKVAQWLADVQWQCSITAKCNRDANHQARGEFNEIIPAEPTSFTKCLCFCVFHWVDYTAYTQVWVVLVSALSSDTKVCTLSIAVASFSFSVSLFINVITSPLAIEWLIMLMTLDLWSNCVLICCREKKWNSSNKGVQEHFLIESCCGCCWWGGKPI